MKGFQFYAVLPQARGSKAASKAYPHDPFTVERLRQKATAGQRVECFALDIADHAGQSWRYNPQGAACVLDFESDRASIGFTSVSLEWLRKRCTRIPATLARELHPELFEYLES